MTSSLPLAQAVLSTKVLMKLYTRKRHTKICTENETGDGGGDKIYLIKNFISEGFWTLLKMKMQ